MIKKVYAKLPDGTKKQVHSIDFSNQYVEVVDYMAFDGISEWCLDEVEIELFQQQLNENQRQVLGWLKTGHCDGDSVFEALERITYVYEDPKTEEALESLSPDQEVQVINSFMKWALEQEEEK
ncbi:hypothetical protein P7E43_10620 [Enterococcus gallinarum]|uniref:hypothetical protein n=1 Tax=Enterococcus gallinarum TaxID=1353 RepID=UPI00288E2C9F|nr:hypothetical protein [Enterococcus gallinarum]MDT2697516.1 hypothetical protein [Enterococcus gallinarum]